MPVKSRREQYSEATKAALLKAATRRFAEHGFAGTALDDVAADIQATRGAVYHHFPSKTALFQAVYENLEKEMISRVAEAGLTETEPWQMVLTALDRFLDHCCDPVYGRLVWQEAPVALGWERWKECEEKYAYGLIEQLITTLVDNGDIPSFPREPMARITFHVVGAAGLALAEAAPEDKPRLKEEYTLVLRYMLGNIRR